MNALMRAYAGVNNKTLVETPGLELSEQERALLIRGLDCLADTVARVDARLSAPAAQKQLHSIQLLRSKLRRER